MLLFIFAFLSYSSYFLQHFKTSHVIVYPIPEGSGAWIFYNFKTSHVIVYRAYAHEERKSKPISKHLMLLFITMLNMNSWLVVYFKTSHVIVYPRPCLPILWVYRHFKTSHVIVYPFPDFMFLHLIVFQNISCYCLSTSEPALLRLNPHFKTSHVIVYLKPVSRVVRVAVFQNISCYCLSL